MGKKQSHPRHEGQIARINRAMGQMEAVKRMIEQGEYCVDIMGQIRAARNALKTVELGVLETHMAACMAQAAKAKDGSLKEKRLKELMGLLKKYE